MVIQDNELYFAKTMESAIIPTKREEDAGYDLYVGDRSKTLVINPNSIITINSGIATAYSDKYSTISFDKSSFREPRNKSMWGSLRLTDIEVHITLI